MGKGNGRQIAVLLFLLTGFFAGTAIPELLSMGTGDYTGFFSLYSFRKYENMQVHSLDLFWYIARLRVWTLLFLWMSTYTGAGILFHMAYAGWLAVSAGMLLALFTLRDGYEGLLLLACCLFPQWILYASMWKKETEILLERNQKTVSPPGRRVSMICRSDLAELGSLLLLCLGGCACEAFLGTWTLKIFLQIFN